MSKGGKVALFLFCLLLTAAVFGYIGWRVFSIQKEADALRVEAEAQAKAAAEAAAAEAQKTPEPTPEATPEPTPEPTPEATPTPEPTPEATPTPEPRKDNIISVRGDSFIYEGEEGAEITEEGYPAKLQKLIDADGLDFVVQDNTWFMAGSLSQMRLAGVSEADVNAYIEAHTAAATAAGVEAGLYETVVRDDLEAKLQEKERDDQNGIPVICIGTNGGWNNDPFELMEQQQKILDTYEQKEKYVIMALYPSYFTEEDSAYYDTLFTEHWGDHFLSLTRYLNYDAMTDEGRQHIAGLLYERMGELGYTTAAAGASTEQTDAAAGTEAETETGSSETTEDTAQDTTQDTQTEQTQDTAA